METLKWHIDDNNAIILENPPKKGKTIWIEFERDLTPETSPRANTPYIIGQNDYQLPEAYLNGNKPKLVWIE